MITAMSDAEGLAEVKPAANPLPGALFHALSDPVVCGRARNSHLPRPNFIFLLGDRYGRRPLLESIPAYEYHEIERRLSGSAEPALITAWHKCDGNGLYEFGDELQ
jgi:hypothetical protein